MDWGQLWEIVSAPDNIPIVAMLFLVPFFTWYAMRQAVANDRLITELEGDSQLAKTHHRKTQPWRPGWAKELHVWPYLLRIEFLAAVIVTVILMVWSITLDAPLEEPSNPNLTMNPLEGVVLSACRRCSFILIRGSRVYMPGLIIVGLMAIPYMDTNPLGSPTPETAAVLNWRLLF
jgi:hypothetical protein